MSEEKGDRDGDYIKGFDENKHLPSSDLDYEYDYDNEEYDDAYDDAYKDSYNFTDYEDLISVSEYMDNPEIDKISNIIIALIKTINILSCKETSFTYDFTYGDYNKWVETAKLFNKNVEYYNNYCILIDEELIVCKLIKYDEDNENDE